MVISESDWKQFKKLREVALDRFCRGVLNDATTISQHEALSTHDRYLKLYRMIHGRDKDMAEAFDHFSRSSAPMCLGYMVKYDLLTDDELSVFSDVMLRGIDYVVRRPYVLRLDEEPERRNK
ncbi:hypothetical protein LOY67_21170 [Pseudomonas sp. B21-056]|jgi:hypothetical protein|uniref:hypothetical protein n=1 Tax=Pseudomonas sp. B21-056 TaxID=2895495 RepID=UPI0022327C77|nr:hypothetical protein [Pseudomonas sp. B21-056]UZE22516.1 hypothetical protein LOY67_21170 [Pseudomonas sp. B21-056]